MSKNVFLNKVIATNATITNQIDEEHIENKDYICANPLAIYGAPPRTTSECLERFFPGYTQDKELNDMVAKLRPSKPTISSNPGSMLPIYDEDPEPDGCTLTCAFTEIKMCDEIEKKIGKTFLGCYYPEPNAPFSCNCPLYGADYPKLLTAALKNTTFWNTPFETPLARRAFLAFLNATKIQVSIDGTFNIRPGGLIDIYDVPNQFSSDFEGKLNGYWIVLSVTNKIFKDRHHETILTLVRAYAPENVPNTETKETNINNITNIQR
jgi:hypothetical protein